MTAKLTSPDGTPASSYCFGAMQFGGKADEPASQPMYEACRAAELNFFDTAYVYTEGRSESILGRLAARERDRLIIATKCAYDANPTEANINASFDESRKRLGMDRVEVLYLHRWNDEVPLEVSLAALAELQSKGKIGHIGVSNFAAWQVMKAEAVARSLGTRIAILQPMYNLVKRQAEVEILPMAASEGFLVAPYSPLGGGLLTGKYASGGEGRLKTDERYTKRYGPAWMHQTAADLAKLAAELGTEPATLAVAWAARQTGVSHPIISARNADQLAPSLAALNFPMDDALTARITALSQAPAPATDRLEEA